MTTTTQSPEGFHSNASWSKIKDSSDFHNLKETSKENFEYAEAICEQLLQRWGVEGSPCEIRGTCTRAWISDASGKEVTRDVYNFRVDPPRRYPRNL